MSRLDNVKGREKQERRGGRGLITKGIILTGNRSSLKGNVVISDKTCSRRFLQLGLSMKNTLSCNHLVLFVILVVLTYMYKFIGEILRNFGSV